jgi:hypothetical protein
MARNAHETKRGAMRKRMAIVVGLLACLTACGGTPATSGPTPGGAAAPTSAGGALPTFEILGGGTPVAAAKSPTVNAAIPPPTGTLTTRVAAATRTATSGATPVTSGTPGVLPEAARVTFAKAPWTQGERTAYVVTTTSDGQTAGNATYTIGGEFEATTVSANLTVGSTKDTFQIGFNGTTFAPTSEVRSIITPQGTISIQSEFHSGGATVQVIDANGTTRNQLTLQDPYYMNDQFLIILRALPFAQGYQGALAIVPSQGNPAAINAVVTVVGQEQITTPAGTFACWKVVAQYEGVEATQTLWFSTDDKHYLVRYDTGKYTYALSEKP